MLEFIYEVKVQTYGRRGVPNDPSWKTRTTSRDEAESIAQRLASKLGANHIATDVWYNYNTSTSVRINTLSRVSR